jgi:tetratricopeptide (TPR) repeat protein
MPQNPDIDAMLDAAIVSHEARDLDRAERLYKQVLGVLPDHAEALNLLGLTLQDRGRSEEAHALISRAIEIDPEFPEAHANLARGLSFLGKAEPAAKAARRATELDPELGEGWLQLGRALLDLGQDQDALDALREAVRQFPDEVEIYAGIGFAAQRMGKHAEALDAWHKVLDMQPSRLDAMVNLGAAYIQKNQLDDALAAHRRAVELYPDDVTALGALAATLHRRYEPNEFVPICRELLARDPARADILTILAAGLTWLGQFEEAATKCEAALLIQPDYVPARQLLGRLNPETLDDLTVARFRAQMDDTALPVQDRASAGFAVAKSLDRAGDFDAAFSMYQRANALYHAQGKAAGKGYDLDNFRAYVEWARTALTPSTIADLRLVGVPSELPVFIVGMPRSGTSLVEQIAASHPRVFGAGERKDIAELLQRINRIPANIPLQRWDRELVHREAEHYISRLQALGGDVDRLIDKMPDNIKVLGQIRAIFPNARIIVCRRDLRDVCVSCCTTHFGESINWAWDFEDCAHQAIEIERLLDHWRNVLPGPVLEISYEALVADMEAESRRLIEFLGLDWDPACLTFHETERPVTTASAQQVRQPIFDSSIGKWRRYEAHLGPMLRILGEHPPVQPVSLRWDRPEAEALRQSTKALTAGDLASAVRILRDATARFPNEHDLLVMLGLTLGQNGDVKEAIATWRHALAMQPKRAHSLANLGLLLTKTGRPGESAELFRQAIMLQPEEYEYHKALAMALWELKDVSGASEAFMDASALAPEDEDILLLLGHCAASLGQFDDAATYYRRVLERNPAMTEARFGLLAIGKAGEADDLSGLGSILADPDKPASDRIWAGFALGKALETTADYDGAFSAYRVANDLARNLTVASGNCFKAAESVSAIDRLIAWFSPEVFQVTADWGDPSDLPVFIVGVPRSGTSLVEQILASHPRVFGAGERADVIPAVRALEAGSSSDAPTSWNPHVVRSEAAAEVARLRAVGGEAIRVIDKLPGNIYWLGHLRILLPNARFIVCRRDPRDVGLSCYFNNFVSGHQWSNDLRDIATQIRQTDRLTSHWRTVLPGPFIEIQYEDLVADLEGESRRLVEFLGLDWDPACLEFHRTERANTTASVWQVRQSLYDSSIGRWRNYQRHLGPLFAGLSGLIEDGGLATELPAREK